jgi:hypothetical protein
MHRKHKKWSQTHSKLQDCSALECIAQFVGRWECLNLLLSCKQTNCSLRIWYARTHVIDIRNAMQWKSELQRRIRTLNHVVRWSNEDNHVFSNIQNLQFCVEDNINALFPGLSDLRNLSSALTHLALPVLHYALCERLTELHVRALPRGLVHLECRWWLTDCLVCQDSLPPALTSLAIFDDKYFCNTKYLPSQLTCLDCTTIYDVDSLSALPQSLRFLKMHSVAQSRIFGLPELPNLNTLQYHYTFEESAKWHIYSEPTFNMDADRLPRSLTSLQIGSRSMQDLVCGKHLENLQSLICFNAMGVNFEVPLPVNLSHLSSLRVTSSLHNLPTKLLHLQANPCDAIALNVLPNTLTILQLGNRFGKPFAKGVLPSSLTRLQCGDFYNSRFYAGILPSNLHTLLCGAFYNQYFELGALPNKLIVLDCGRSYNRKFDYLPSSLRVLRCPVGNLSRRTKAELRANKVTIECNEKQFPFFF